MVGNEGKKVYRFVTVDCRKMHLRAPEQLKMSPKIFLTTTFLVILMMLC